MRRGGEGGASGTGECKIPGGVGEARWDAKRKGEREQEKNVRRGGASEKGTRERGRLFRGRGTRERKRRRDERERDGGTREKETEGQERKGDE